MKPVITIAILLLIILSAYVLFISKTVEESEGFGQPSEADIRAAIELTSMNGPSNFGGFPNQIGQSGSGISQMSAYSSNPLIQYQMNNPYSGWSQPSSAISQPIKTPESTQMSQQANDIASALKTNITSNANNINNAFDSNGKLKDEYILPLQTGVNSVITGLKTNLTKDNLNIFLTHTIEVATTLKQQLSSGSTTAPVAAAKTTTTECKFDAAAYSKFYPDLQKAFNGDAAKLKTHYKTYGLNEGRTPCGATLPTCKFVAAAYSSYYPDLQKAFNGDADKLKAHYINNGINENRNVCKVTK
jgi:hypothetical protein